ncbi:MAG: hypothetical protein EKK51_09580 [Mycolicibacterium sp.]|uniref:hypothetical protein n=1 Tax=Mycobacteriaceae TaxID=1762 RepID=UPI000FA3E5D6|nr:hypothetical protein [Mycolicibacterium sp.]RUP32562.1 MAG: hypothetical protein EKK51_09580 [Mycolicibacterium sp.]
MPEQALMVSPVALMLAGSVCLAWSSKVTGRSQRRRQLATVVLLVLSGLIGVGAIVITTVHLSTQPWTETTIGDTVATLFVDGIAVLSAIVLLGYIGFWAYLRDLRRSAAPDTPAPAQGQDT